MNTPVSNGIVPLAEIKLKDPVHEGSEIFDTVIIKRKPTLGDMDGLSLTENMDSIGIALLLGRISNMATPLVKRITLTDMVEVMGVLKPFLPDTGDGV